MWTQVISNGTSTCGRCGLSSTVAGTSLMDRVATNNALAPRIGQASGQTTYRAAASVEAPSTAARSRNARHGALHVAPAASSAIQPKRATYAIVTVAALS